MSNRDGASAHVGVARDDLTAESPFTLPGFFAALAEGRLIAGRCRDCGEGLLPPRPACYQCGSREIELEQQPETGTVYTYTEVRHPSQSFPVEPPFAVGIVELDSGIRLTGRFIDPYETIEIGSSVQWCVRDLSEVERQYALEHEKDWPIHLFEAV